MHGRRTLRSHYRPRVRTSYLMLDKRMTCGALFFSIACGALFCALHYGPRVGTSFLTLNKRMTCGALFVHRLRGPFCALHYGPKVRTSFLTLNKRMTCGVLFVHRLWGAQRKNRTQIEKKLNQTFFSVFTLLMAMGTFVREPRGFFF